MPRHPGEPPNAVQEVLAGLVGTGRRLRHPDMAGISGLTNRRVLPPLPDPSQPSEQNAERRIQPCADQTAHLQPQGQQPSVRLSEAELALTCAERQMHICVSEGCHADILSGARGKSTDPSFVRNRNSGGFTDPIE